MKYYTHNRTTGQNSGNSRSNHPTKEELKDFIAGLSCVDVQQYKTEIKANKEKKPDVIFSESLADINKLMGKR